VSRARPGLSTDDPDALSAARRTRCISLIAADRLTAKRRARRGSSCRALDRTHDAQAQIHGNGGRPLATRLFSADIVETPAAGQQ
jgi:hypothetical protein